LSTPFNNNRGRFSPEPSPDWVAYQSDESGRWEIYIQSFPEPRGKFQISTAGGRNPQWNASGNELYYVSAANRLMSVNLKLRPDSVEPSAPRELFALPTIDSYNSSPYEASPDGQRFLVRATAEQAAQVQTVIVNWPALLKKSAVTR
jgi:Tol biopolymer transport system component